MDVAQSKDKDDNREAKGGETEDDENYLFYLLLLIDNKTL